MENSVFELAALIMMIIVPILIFALACFVLEIIALWFIFEKAGEPGWAAIGLFSFRFSDLEKRPIPETNQNLMLKPLISFFEVLS